MIIIISFVVALFVVLALIAMQTSAGLQFDLVVFRSTAVGIAAGVVTWGLIRVFIL